MVEFRKRSFAGLLADSDFEIVLGFGFRISDLPV
jgi:hypothetical protein